MRALVMICGLLVAAGVGWWSGGLVVARQQATQMAPVYDHQVAYYLASLGVAPETQEYFMFDLNPESDSEKLAKQMTEAFAAADEEGKSLGVTGDDAAHNQAILRRAVTQSQGRQYPRMTLIVVGPRAQRKPTQAIVAPTGAQFRYFAYP